MLDEELGIAVEQENRRQGSFLASAVHRRLAMSRSGDFELLVVRTRRAGEFCFVFLPCFLRFF